jgi:hypothetical protein
MKKNVLLSILVIIQIWSISSFSHAQNSLPEVKLNERTRWVQVKKYDPMTFKIQQNEDWYVNGQGDITWNLNELSLGEGSTLYISEDISNFNLSSKKSHIGFGSKIIAIVQHIPSVGSKSAGSSAPNLYIDLGDVYSPEIDYKFKFFKDCESSECTGISELEPYFEVLSKGGLGATGSIGSAGANGRDAACLWNDKSSTKGGDGASGQPGTVGGIGGDITFKGNFFADIPLSSLRITAPGGQGGKGGEGGKGGWGGASAECLFYSHGRSSNGNKGNAGKDGARGDHGLVQIQLDQLLVREKEPTPFTNQQKIDAALNLPVKYDLKPDKKKCAVPNDVWFLCSPPPEGYEIIKIE